jgi:hypothetical protein
MNFNYIENEEQEIEKEIRSSKNHKKKERKIMFKFLFAILAVSGYAYADEYLLCSHFDKEIDLKKGDTITWQCKYCQRWNLTENVRPLKCLCCGKTQ